MDQEEAGSSGLGRLQGKRQREVESAINEMSRATLHRLIKKKKLQVVGHQECLPDQQADTGSDRNSNTDEDDTGSVEENLVDVPPGGSSDNEDTYSIGQNPVGDPAGGSPRTEESSECSIGDDSEDEEPRNTSSESDTSSEESEDSDTSGEDEPGPPYNPYTDEALHGHTNIQTGEYLLMILEMYVKNRMSKKLLNDILTLINVAMPQPNKLPNTKYKLFSFINTFIGDCVVNKHRYCENINCHNYLGVWEQTEHFETCTKCGGNNIQGLFIENSVSQIIKHSFEKRQLYKFYKENLLHDNSEDISDICNGIKYKEVNINRNEFDVTLLWNTDGVPVFKSSNSQLWPILLVICELLPEKRKQNVLVAGLWFGNSKPNMNTYLRPFSDSIRNLSVHGVVWRHPDNGRLYNSKVNAPIVSVDAQARAPMQNISLYNGEHGCFQCEHPGVGHPRVYPPQLVPAPPRSHAKMQAQAVTAIEQGKKCLGVKGLSYLSTIPFFDLAKSFIPDYLHCCLLGVTRSFLNLWLDSSNHANEWYIGTERKMKLIDTVLLKIKPPNDLNRVPRSVVKRVYWKGSELRSWLLFFSVPCLNNLLPKKYLEHWMCLVGAINLLLLQAISPLQIELAEILLNSFVNRIPNLYGVSQNKYNVHQLLHLPESVKNWGPLWATSTFMFENANGEILRLLHGSQQITQQLILTNQLIMAWHVLKNLFPKADMHPQLINGAIVLGRSNNKNIAGEVRSEIAKFIRESNEPESVNSIHSRISINGSIFTSAQYKKERKRDSSLVSFKFIDNVPGTSEIIYGKICCFVSYNVNGLYCVINKMKTSSDVEFVDSETGFKLNHIIPVTNTNEYLHIRPLNITGKVIRINNVICLQPNSVERNL